MLATATIQLDGQEITLLTQAAIAKSKVEFLAGNYHRSGQYVILAEKLAEAKTDFHQRHYSYLNEKYALNDKKPAGEQT